MGNLANLSVTDGDASPVTHTFEVDGKVMAEGGKLTWNVFKDKALGVSIAYPVLSLSLRKPTKTNSNYKMALKISVPALEVASGSNIQGFTPPAVVAYSTLGSVEFVLPERSTLAERKDIIAMTVSALQIALVKSMVTDYVDLY